MKKPTKNKIKLGKFKIKLNMTVSWKSTGEGRGKQIKKNQIENKSCFSIRIIDVGRSSM